MDVNLENMRAWVAALCDPDRFRQGRSRLATRVGDTWEYCCLGVACELALEAGVSLVVEESGSKKIYDGHHLNLPMSVREWLGVEQTDPWLRSGLTAAMANDSGHSFPAIADMIEDKFINLPRTRAEVSRQVPLKPGETEHLWRKAKLHGCETCGYHDGVECVHCHRVIDSQMDPDLAALVARTDPLPEETDENDS